MELGNSSSDKSSEFVIREYVKPRMPRLRGSDDLHRHFVHYVHHLGGVDQVANGRKRNGIDGPNSMNFPQGNLVYRYNHINGKAVVFDGSKQKNFPQGNLVHCYNHNNDKAVMSDGSNQMNFRRKTLFIVTIITMTNPCLMVILIQLRQLTIWTKLLPTLLFFLIHGSSDFSSLPCSY
uniref:Uncharacterized protein n=1 Tax=Solanum lycopersicum TaxID=4081 RepID=A0A3Q7F570_SOLLC